MDTALTLRICYDKGERVNQDEIIRLLDTSQLVSQLTSSFQEKPLYAVWRIIALSEIPYVNQLAYTNQVVDYIQNHLATPSGFALTGKADDLLPCYNAMLLEALSKLGYAETECVQNAVQWIKKYQPFERSIDTGWQGKGTQKYGGCLKATPCFIGVAKAVKALAHYSIAIKHEDKEITQLIQKGMEYLLMHELYRKLSDGQPINNHIQDIAFPASYHLNIVELLETVRLTGYIHDSKCKSALNYINKKRTKENHWKINYIYKADGYHSFDQRGEKGDWVTYLLNRCTESQYE